MKDFIKKHQTRICAVLSLFLFLLPLVRIIFVETTHGLFLLDFASYSDVSITLFKGVNPFPNHVELLTILPRQNNVPIVYPGQMLLFALPGFLWGRTVQIAYLLLNIGIIFFLTGLTLVKACGYQWDDLWKPGWKQFVYALFCFCFFSSSNVMTTMRIGQIPVILALCLYGMFWGPPLRGMRIFLFAFIAVTKYSLLTVLAPLLFLKGHWKLCVAAFLLFVFFSISPVFCGNDLKEVYLSYFESIPVLFQPGEVNHFDRSPIMFHLGFFRLQLINHILKIFVISFILYLLWKEHKTRYISDTLLLLALSLTMLISYHSIWGFVLFFPLLFIRLFAFAKEKNYRCFVVTALFVLYVLVPATPLLMVSSAIGRIPGIDSVFILANRPYGREFYHVFPITPFYAIVLAAWSLLLYLRVKEPYRFVIPELTFRGNGSPMPLYTEELNNKSHLS